MKSKPRRSRRVRRLRPPQLQEQEERPFFSKNDSQADQTGRDSAFFQTKKEGKSISRPGDEMEKEADSVANAVSNKAKAVAPIQERSAQELADGKTLSTNQIALKIESKKGSGRPLSKKERIKIESTTGADFSHVHIHTDSEAAAMNEELGAEAFTSGADVFFNTGKYAPESSAGEHLLAHELTHVAQQGQAGLRSPIQTRLPRIRTPRIPNMPGLPDAVRQDLVAKMQAYQSDSSLENGQLIVDAINQQLESGGTVAYTGQSDITADSPKFRIRPSMTAQEQARQSGHNLSSTAGFTFMSSNKNKVEIYPSAFIGATTEAQIGYLAGVIAHEFIHVLQNRRSAPSTDAQREFQAWLWQAEHLQQLGIPPQSVGSAQIAGNLRRYYEALPGGDRRALQGRYERARQVLNSPA